MSSLVFPCISWLKRFIRKFQKLYVTHKNKDECSVCMLWYSRAGVKVSSGFELPGCSDLEQPSREEQHCPPHLKELTQTSQLQGSTPANQRPRFSVDRRGACRPRPAADGRKEVPVGRQSPSANQTPAPRRGASGTCAGACRQGPCLGTTTRRGPATSPPAPARGAPCTRPFSYLAARGSRATASLEGYDTAFSRNLPRARVGQSAAPKSLPREESKEAAPTILRARAELAGEMGGLERSVAGRGRGRAWSGVAGPELKASGGGRSLCVSGAGRGTKCAVSIWSAKESNLTVYKSWWAQPERLPGDDTRLLWNISGSHHTDVSLRARVSCHHWLPSVRSPYKVTQMRCLFRRHRLLLPSFLMSRCSHSTMRTPYPSF